MVCHGCVRKVCRRVRVVVGVVGGEQRVADREEQAGVEAAGGGSRTVGWLGSAETIYEKAEDEEMAEWGVAAGLLACLETLTLTGSHQSTCPMLPWAPGPLAPKLHAGMHGLYNYVDTSRAGVERKAVAVSEHFYQLQEPTFAQDP